MTNTTSKYHNTFTIHGFEIGGLKVGKTGQRVELAALMPTSSRKEHVVMGIHEKGEIIPLIPPGRRIDADTRTAMRQQILSKLAANYPDKKFAFPQK